MSAAEWIGYAGSLVVLVSLLMKSLVKLRWLNLAGSLLFGLYGLLIHAWPVFIINTSIVAIDAWFLFQMSRVTDYFDWASLERVGHGYFRMFFLYHEKDIRHFFPDTTFEMLTRLDTHMLFRNMLPVGFIALDIQGEEARILADYVIQEYRDFKIARFVFDIKRMHFKERGVRRFVARTGHALHKTYLLRNGFTPVGHPDDGLYVKEI